MKLTPENLDFADSADLGKPTGVTSPAWLLKLIADAEREKAAKPIDTASPEKSD